jgi:hypothetical protein
MTINTEVWYEIEYSEADGWYRVSYNGSFDTETAAQAALKHRRTNGCAKWNYRVVRKTLTTEVLP